MDIIEAASAATQQRTTLINLPNTKLHTPISSYKITGAILITLPPNHSSKWERLLSKKKIFIIIIIINSFLCKQIHFLNIAYYILDLSAICLNKKKKGGVNLLVSSWCFTHPAGT